MFKYGTLPNQDYYKIICSQFWHPCVHTCWNSYRAIYRCLSSFCSIYFPIFRLTSFCSCFQISESQGFIQFSLVTRSSMICVIALNCMSLSVLEVIEWIFLLPWGLYPFHCLEGGKICVPVFMYTIILWLFVKYCHILHCCFKAYTKQT